MNDKFLRSYRVAPGLAFVQDLRNRLEINGEKPLRVKTLRLHPVVLGVIVLLLVFTMTVAISPAVRAQVQEWAGMIGGVFFTATGDYPGGDGPVTTIPGDEMSLEEARAVLPFTVDLPAWVPEGYVFEETVSILRLEDEVDRIFIHWNAPQKPLLELQIENTVNSNWAVGPGSMEEVQVNGEPAALVRGGWNADEKQWADMGQIHLYVQHRGQTYIFSAMEKDISAVELVHIAESLP